MEASLMVLFLVIVSTFILPSSPHRVIPSTIINHDQPKTNHHHHHHHRSHLGWGWEGGIQIDFPSPVHDDDGFVSGEGGFQFEFWLPGFGPVVVSGGGSVGETRLPFPTFPLPGLSTNTIQRPNNGDPFYCAPLSCIKGDALGCQLSYGVTQSFVQTGQHGGPDPEPPLAAAAPAGHN